MSLLNPKLKPSSQSTQFLEEMGKPHLLHFMASKGNIPIFEQALQEISLEKQDMLFSRWSRHEILPEPYLSLINWRDSGNNTPLHWATYGFKLEMARQMVKWGAVPQFKNHKDITPLEQAFRAGEEGVNLALEWIKEGKVDPHLEFKTGRGSWLHILLSNGPNSPSLQFKLFNSLIELGVDIQRVNNEGEKIDCASFLNRNHIEGDLYDIILMQVSRHRLNQTRQSSLYPKKVRL